MWSSRQASDMEKYNGSKPLQLRNLMMRPKSNTRGRAQKGLVYQGPEEDITEDSTLQHITQHLLSDELRIQFLNYLRMDESYAQLLELILDILKSNN